MCAASQTQNLVVRSLGFAAGGTIYNFHTKNIKKVLLFGPCPVKISFCMVGTDSHSQNFCLREVFGLPNIKSAKKRVLIAEVRNARNKATKSELKTAIKKFEAAAAEGNRTEADGAYKVAVKKVDQAVAKGVLHKNTAAHRKSAMTLKLNKIG